ncbi:MAG TPA: DUF58 domain-containing protein [Bryobacteraceae bacterium]|nr:DUF58 domain-containing protein [Bryobacteraceae bacterium]
MLPEAIVDRLRYVEIYTTRAVRAHRAGDYLSRIRGRSFEFDQHKPYQQGDDYRQIDWNVTARMQSPFVKRELEEKELSAIIMVDLSRSMLFSSAAQNKKELSLEVAAMLAFSAAADNMNVGMLAFTDRVECYLPPKRGNSQAWRLIETLWELTPRGRGTNFEPALDLLSSNLRHTALIFCLSDFIAAGSLWDSPYLKTVAHKVDFVPVILEDSWEEALPETSGYLRLKDSEDGREMVLALSPKRCRHYRTALQERREDVRKHLYGLNLDHLTLNTGEDYLKRILKFFVARKRRR